MLEKASMEREVELEHRAMESSTALARIQVNYGRSAFMTSFHGEFWKEIFLHNFNF